VRLRSWLAERCSADTHIDADAVLAQAAFYSDSINDLPLLSAVGRPVAVDPDARLEQEARARQWPVLRLPRPVFSETP
jgi:phosphoserine phosphatase